MYVNVHICPYICMCLQKFKTKYYFRFVFLLLYLGYITLKHPRKPTCSQININVFIHLFIFIKNLINSSFDTIAEQACDIACAYYRYQKQNIAICKQLCINNSYIHSFSITVFNFNFIFIICGGHTCKTACMKVPDCYDAVECSTYDL